MKPRHYQNFALNTIFNAKKNGKNIVLTAPTGSGKTVITALANHRLIKRGERCMNLMFRQTILQQHVETFKKVGISESDIAICEGGKEITLEMLAKPCLIVMTITNQMRDFTLQHGSTYGNIFVDEAHSGCHADPAQHPSAFICGLTATPVTSKASIKYGLRQIYNGFQFHEITTTAALMNEGYLCRPTTYTLNHNNTKAMLVDYRQSTYTRYDKNRLNLRRQWIENEMPKIFQDPISVVYGKKAVIFSETIAHAEDIYNSFAKLNFPNVYMVHSKQGKKLNEQSLARFAQSPGAIMINVASLTTGYDLPGIECLVLTKKISSPTLYFQIVGRVLRPANGKEPVIIDPLENCFYHGTAEYPPNWLEFSKHPMDALNFKTDRLCRNPQCFKRKKFMFFVEGDIKTAHCTCGASKKMEVWDAFAQPQWPVKKQQSAAWNDVPGNMHPYDPHYTLDQQDFANSRYEF